MKYDVIIIGGGPGGTRAAQVLARRGKQVALVSDDLGGECLNYGCIPTKVYLWTAEFFEKVSNASAFGIELENPRINWELMQRRRRDVTAKLKKNLRFSLERAGVKILEGRGILKNATTITVTATATEGTETLDIEAASIILAAGSKAVFPSGFTQSKSVMSNREILDLPSVPKSLFIIGGGAVGVEFASIFAALGTKVTIAESADRLLPNEDHEVSAELERIFARKGITIMKNTRATPEQAKGFEVTLLAVGRTPSHQELGLKNAGVKHEQHGVPTNEQYQTNIPHIFAIGDLAGKALLAYTADREGEIAARKILGENSAPLRYETVPYTTFCTPEVASVGLTEARAKEKNLDYTVGKSLYSANSKALITGSRDGFAKVIADKKSHAILGVHIIGEKASELIGEASLALSAGLTADEFTENLHSHPILGEVLKDACEGALYR